MGQTIDIGIPEAELTEIVHGLSKVLADSYTLYLKTQPAPATYRQFTELTVLTEESDLPDATEMVRRLRSAHETTSRTIRAVLPVVEAAPDQVSTDLLVRRLDVHEKTAWMLRSILA